MTIKRVFNEIDGSRIESLIYERLRRYVFTGFPFSDVRPFLCVVTDDANYPDGIYIYLKGNYSGLSMRIPEDMLLKLLTSDSYVPFMEDKLKEIYLDYMECEEYIRNLKARGLEIANMRGRTHTYIKFRKNKPVLLKRILGGSQCESEL